MSSSPLKSRTSPTVPLVTFSGPWTPERRSAVEAAIRDYESESSPDAIAPTVPPWVCQCLQVDGEDWFFARRHRTPGVLTARSAATLARRIREEAVAARRPAAQPVHWPKEAAV